MKYALKYFSTSKKMAEADEIIIAYNKKSENLGWFIETYCQQNQRLVIDYNLNKVIRSILKETEDGNFNFTENEVLELINCEVNKIAEVNEKYENDIAVKLVNPAYNYYDSFASLLKEKEIPFFFDISPNSFSEVNTLIKMGVSDIYICNELAFQITEVSKLIHAANINIRVHPNVAQLSGLNSLIEQESLKQFFIRPEDLELYGKYADIVEFFGTIDKQDVLMDIYKDGYWMGDLNNLIIGFDESINCMNLMPDFGFYRLGCGHRCDLGKCNYCDISKSLAKELKNKDIYIKKEKKKYEYKTDENDTYNGYPEAI